MSETSSPFAHIGTLEHRQSPTPHQHIRYIKEAIVNCEGEYALEEQEVAIEHNPAILGKQPVKEIDFIRYQLLSEQRRSYTDGPIGHLVRPKKIILYYRKTPFWGTHVSLPGHWRAGSIVDITYNHSAWPISAFSFDTLVKPRLAVYIVAPFTRPDESSQYDVSPPETPQEWVAYHGYDFASYVLEENHPNETIIVNDWANEPTAIADDIEANAYVLREFLAIVERQHKVLSAPTRKSVFGFTTNYKSAKELANLKFTFLSFSEYLAQYDWTGEFTYEQVKDWL